MFSHVVVGNNAIGFAGQSTQQVDQWHAAGVANGGTSVEAPPGGA